MTAVFVHGVPETPAVWTPLLAQLGRDDVVALQLPGFGVPAPPDFSATKEAYTDWLVTELGTIGEPVDLVGHDWGGGFALRVACTRPDLLRSWVSDVAGLLDPAYVWHDFAQIWQTPGVGEQYFADTLSQPPEAVAALYESVGITPEAAQSFAQAADDEMARCILALYRSAAQPAMAVWGEDAEQAAARPGHVIVPPDDPFAGGAEGPLRSAARLGATTTVLDGLGHWWMLQDPARGAQVLRDFWAAL
jgi:pimeloyl-ACP methyl ester carboxylesterase